MKIEFKNRPGGAVWLHVFATLLLVLAAGGAAHAQTRGDVNDAAAVSPTPLVSPTPIVWEPAPSPTPVGPTCDRTIKADVVALDQVITFNRLGAVNPGGMMFALRNDVKAINTASGMVAGNVQLKDYKRPRPLTLRMNVGDCLQILFQNLLSAVRKDEDQPNTRSAGVHVAGMQLVNSIADDGSNVGVNTSSLVAPGGSTVYTLYAEREGTHLLYSSAATTGGEGDGGTIPEGLFGAVNVEVKGAEWYRSQLTKADLALATKKDTAGVALKSAGGHPAINYDAVYPTGNARAGKPILKI